MVRKRSAYVLERVHRTGDMRERVLHSAACPFLAEHGMFWASIKQVSTDHELVRKDASQFSLSVTFDGRGQFWTGREWQTVSAGQAIVYPADSCRGFRTLPDTYWQYGSFVFFERKQYQPFRHDRVRMLKVNTKSLSSIFDVLHSEASSRQDARLMAHLAAALHRELSIIAQHEHADDTMDAAWIAVESDLARQWTIQAMASLAHMSLASFRRRCHARFAQSPSRRLLQLRVMRAVALLSNPYNQVKDVAERVGYPDSFAFSRAFRRIQGESPKQFQMRHLQDQAAQSD